jgi:hypothetical protein
MKAAIFAGAFLGLVATASVADAGLYWVVGNRATNRCEIVTSNPVINYTTIWFGDGPYKSRADAKLARSTIGACPKTPDPDEE